MQMPNDFYRPYLNIVNAELNHLKKKLTFNQNVTNELNSSFWQDIIKK